MIRRANHYAREEVREKKERTQCRFELKRSRIFRFQVVNTREHLRGWCLPP